MRILRVIILSVLVWFTCASLQAQVSARLLSESDTYKPGAELTVYLELTHADHWHTYWTNPGTGLATDLIWKLPEGWRAEEPQWPVPSLIKDSTGAIAGHGYEGTVLIPVTLHTTEAKDGAPIRLALEVKWLMCKEACIPGGQKTQLLLTASGDQAASAAGPLKDKTIKTLPAPMPAGTSLNAWLSGKQIVFEVSGTGVAGVANFSGIHFFPEDETINYELPQIVSQPQKGVLRLALPAGSDTVTRLKGILRRDEGWPSAHDVRGYFVDLPLGTAPTSHTSSTGTGTGSSEQTGMALGYTLFLALLGGLILNLMPCVFPVLGIKILGFVQQSGADSKKVMGHALVFTAGVMLSFWTLALMLHVLRAGGAQLGWGFQLQSPGFVIGLAVVMLLFALNMSGLFEFGLSATAVGSDLQMKQGLSGSFFTGVLATVVATPCSAPFLAPALGAALTLPPVEAWLVFTAIGLGLSAPYLILSAFPSLVKVLPRPGAWMEGFKQAMAFPLYATTAYLVWVLAGQLDDARFLNVLMALVLLAFAAWEYGRHVQQSRKPAKRAIALARILVYAVLGLWLCMPPQTTQTAAPAWEKWSPERLTAARAEGRPVYVDFTARWCVTCQTNKKLVFGSSEVLADFAKQRVVLLKADWTNSDPAITAELARWNRSAVPFNLVYLPGQSEPTILPEVLTPDIVLKALNPPSTAK